MSVRLIVNSDDYGRTAEVSRGVRAAHLNGIVSSTTCMMNIPTVVEDIRIAQQVTPNLGLGVHLVLTAGKPLLPASQVASLTSPDGSFQKLEQFLEQLDQADSSQVKAEWRTQIETFIKTTGCLPTHLDSHHHTSYFTEPLFHTMLELAQEYGAGIRLVFPQEHAKGFAGLSVEGLPTNHEFAPRLLREFRPKTPDVFYTSFYAQNATKLELLRLIWGLKPGTAEIMCHPGYADSLLLVGSSYARQRESELAVLTDPEIRQAIQDCGIELISFAQL
jgi:predicted glycoside hydrolase/deacetylase ChbG (UPF0249 family)